MILNRFAPLLLVLSLSSCSSTAPPSIMSKKLIAEAVDTLYQFSLHENLKHYKKFLKGAAGIVIFPEVIKAGWVAGAEAGISALLLRYLVGPELSHACRSQHRVPIWRSKYCRGLGL